MKKFWALFFFFWPLVAIYACAIAPSRKWWFPSEAMTPLGQQIDGLFYLILGIVTVVFVGTQFALGYALWKGAKFDAAKDKAEFSHGSHSLEIIWTVVPSFVLVFIALYQMNVWAEFRIQNSFPEEAQSDPLVEVSARQFEWRMRYPAPGKPLKNQHQIDDLHAVNEMHVPTGRPVLFNLRTMDIQHAFFAPELRVKQDAVAGLIIPVWFEIPKAGDYTLVCAELCGWGHYKMRATIVAESQPDLDEYLANLKAEQEDDGVEEDADDE